jgi:hypothetical protein
MDSKKRIAVIFGSPQTFELQGLKYFILSLNGIQNFYEFSFPIFDNHPFGEGAETLRDEEIEKRISKLPNSLIDNYHFLVVIVSRQMEENLFYYSHEDYLVVTTHEWESSYKPPTVFDYLIYCIVTTLIDWESGYETEAHDDETIGCIFDYTQTKEDIRSGIMLGYICEDHHEYLNKALPKNLFLIFNFGDAPQ